MKFTFDKVTVWTVLYGGPEGSNTNKKKENANENEKVKLTLSF